MEDLQKYCNLLGYELKETDGLIVLKDSVTHKSVILQRDHGKLVVIRDEAIPINIQGDIEVLEMSEDISDNILLAKRIAPLMISNASTTDLGMTRRKTTASFLKSLLEIKCLDIHQL